MFFNNIISSILKEDNEQTSLTQAERAQRLKLLPIRLAIESNDFQRIATVLAAEFSKGLGLNEVNNELLQKYIRKKNEYRRELSSETFKPIGDVIDGWLKGHKTFKMLTIEDFEKLFIRPGSPKSYLIQYVVEKYKDFTLIPKTLWRECARNFMYVVRGLGNEIPPNTVPEEFYKTTSTYQGDNIEYGIGSYIATCIKTNNTNKIPAPWLEHLNNFLENKPNNTGYGNLLPELFSTRYNDNKVVFDEMPSPVQKLILLNKKQVYHTLYHLISFSQKDRVDLKLLTLVTLDGNYKNAFHVYKRWKMSGYDVNDLPTEIQIEANKAYASGYINPYTDNFYSGDHTGVVEEVEIENIEFRGQDCLVMSNIELGYDLEAEEEEYASSSIATSPSYRRTGRYFVSNYEVHDVKDLAIFGEDGSTYDEDDLTPEEKEYLQIEVADRFSEIADRYLDQLSETNDY